MIVDASLETVRDWLLECFPELAEAGGVIYADPDDISAPRPEQPYATIQYGAMPIMGNGSPYVETTDTIGEDDDLVVQQRFTAYAATVEIVIFGNNSWALLSDLANRGTAQDIYDVLCDGGVSFIRMLSPVIDVTQIRGTVREQSARVEISIGCVAKFETETPYVETVAVTLE